MPSQGNTITATDINSVVSLANATLAKYGYSPTISGKTALVDYINGGGVYSQLVSGLTTINSNASCLTPVAVTDLDNYNSGSYIFSSLITLLTTKYYTVSNGYCSCQCNYCSCNCNHCSCNCDRCSCNGYCSCQCNKAWHCTISSQHTCFNAGQMIYTSKGVVSIENVTEGDYLYNPYIDDYTEVTAAWNIAGDTQSMVRIEGQGFEISVTDNHPLPLYNKTTQQIEVIQPSKVANSLINDYCALFPIPKAKDRHYHEYNTDIDIDAKFISIIPYLVLFYKNDNIHCASDKILDRIEKIIIDFVKNIKYARTIDGIHIYRNNENIIEGRSIHDIFEMTVSHGIPNWIYEFDKKEIEKMLNEFEFIFENMGVEIDSNIKYQLRLLYALFGKEFSVKEYNIYNRHVFTDSFLLIPITHVKFENINTQVYNVVTKSSTHACLVDIISLDGFNNGHL